MNVFALFLPWGATAEEGIDETWAVFGFKVRAGGRYDDVRMCIATDAGVKGGMAMDVSLFTEFGLGEDRSLHIDLPVMRPILFGLGMKMLQFEPSATLKFRTRSEGNVELVGGPTIGLSLHYGPDYLSEREGDGRRTSFFAIGPTVGGYVGLDFERPGKTFNFEVGLSPFVTPLFGVDDPDDHRGVVVGALLDGSFRFRTEQ